MYRRTSSINRSRGHWREEQMSANAVHNAQARNPQPVATDEQHELLGKYAKRMTIHGSAALTASEYAVLAQHPGINERARSKFLELAAQ